MTTTYPIEIQKVSLDHRGGTKSYHLLLAARADGKCLLVKRWGKKGQFGDIKEEFFNTVGFAERAFEKVLGEKTGRGYKVVDDTNVNKTAVNEGLLLNHFGRILWAKLSATAIKQLDDTIDTTGRRDPEPPRWEENGDFIGDAPGRVPVYTPEELAEQKRIVEEEKAAELAAKAAEELAKVETMRARNPNYGRF